MNFKFEDAKNLNFRESTLSSNAQETINQHTELTEPDKDDERIDENKNFNISFFFFPLMMSFFVGIFIGKNFNTSQACIIES